MYIYKSDIILMLLNIFASRHIGTAFVRVRRAPLLSSSSLGYDQLFCTSVAVSCVNAPVFWLL